MSAEESDDSHGGTYTMPVVLIFPLSRSSMARGKQYVCENDPMMLPVSHCSFFPSTLARDSLDLVQEDFGRRPGDSGVVGVHSVHEQRSASGDVVDRVVDNLLDTRALDNDVEAVCPSANCPVRVAVSTYTGCPS